MDIPLVNIASTSRTGSVAPVAPAQTTAVAQAQTAAALVSLTTVDLSPLGRFLSAVTLFQKKLQELQSAPGPLATERDSGDAFAAVAAAALGLAVSANELQASSLNGTSDDRSLASLFGQQFAALTPGDDDDGDSAAQLAAIGLTFTSPSGVEEGDVLNVDLAVLQAAFAGDPEGTTALLARAGAAFSALAGIAPGAGNEVDPSDLTVDATDQATGPRLATPQPPPALPDTTAAAAASPAQVTSDSAFLQELLAETPRPGLSQAAPPSVAEANANFAAQRAVDINAQNGLQDQLAVPTAVDAQRVVQASLSGALPVAPQLPAAATPVAARATETAGMRLAELAELADDPRRALIAAQAEDQAAARVQDATLATRTLAGQALAAQEAVRDTDELTASTIATARAAQAAGLDAQAIDEAAIKRGDQQAGERMRLAEAGNEERLAQVEEQKRLERSREARERILDEADAARSRLEQVATNVTRPVPLAQLTAQAQQVDPPIPPVPPRPLPPPVNQAQLAARDPAVAAAIAAYNLSAGPFAALNVKPELAAPKIKTIPSVETVTKVEPIDDDGPTNTNSRPFR